MTLYDEAYFRERNYEDYLARGPRYARMAAEVTSFLERAGVLERAHTLLDFGCGPGLFCRGLREAGYKHVTGYDVSPWAIEYGLREFRVPMLSTSYEMVMWGEWRLGFALDVFEHMKDEEVARVLREVRPEYWLVRIPVSKVDGGRFILPVSNEDPHHINPKSKDSWRKVFAHAGYDEILRPRLFSIYDDVGVYCALFRRSE
jgi:SAM-dependent methyltransferase